MTETNIGSIITNVTARKVVYGLYALSAVVVGGVAAYFIGIGLPIPDPLTGAQAVVAYLAIPVGGLALANTGKPAEQPASVVASVEAPVEAPAETPAA